MEIDKIKKLRELTSFGISDCKQALAKSENDFDKALDFLRTKGAEIAEKKSGRETSQGRIDSYIHFDGNLGALVEVNCESDFVAKTDNFKKFVKDLAMQVAAISPSYVSKEDMPEAELKDVENKEEYIRRNCLMEQEFIKDSKKTIKEYLQELISQTGENINIRRFVRFSLGQEQN
jgi:elongation factor Ts